MKALLTSTGFDNDVIEREFRKLLNRPSGEAKALFVPTALNTPELRGLRRGECRE